MRSAAIRFLALAGVIVFGPLLLLGCSSSTEPDGDDDGQAPAPITDLAIASFTTHSVTLTWTAPGDDGDVGTAARYEVRMHDDYIAPPDWADATVAPGAPAPSPAGATESMTIDGLTEDATYFFAVTAWDEQDNTPGCSNCASATCYDNEEIGFADPAVAAAVRDALGIPDAPLLRQDVRRLTELNIADAGVTSLAGLEECVNLRGLVACGNSIADLSPLAGLTAITELDLGRNLLADLTPLAGLTAAVHVRLADNRITDVSPLAAMAVLELLDLARNPLADVSPLAGLTALTALDLADDQVADLAGLAAMTALEILNLAGNAVTDLSPLAGLTALEILNLTDNAATSLSPLAGLTSMVWLYVSGNPAGDLGPLAGMSALQLLDARDVGATATAALSGLTAMRYLMLSDNAIVDLSGLSAMTAVEMVDVGNNNVTDLSPLAGKASLTNLRCYLNAITDLSPLTGLTALDVVDFDSNHVTDLQALVDNPGLGEGDEVDAQQNPLSDDALNIQVPALRDRGVDVIVTD